MSLAYFLESPRTLVIHWVVGYLKYLLISRFISKVGIQSQKCAVLELQENKVTFRITFLESLQMSHQLLIFLFVS